MAKYTLDKDGNIVPTLETGLPQPSPQDFADEQEPVEQERPESEKRIRWLQESTFPGANKYSDGISDLLEGPNLEEEDADVADLVDVDFEKDIIDAGEDGTLDDLVNVNTMKDIIGFEGGNRPSRTRPQPRARRPIRYGDTPPTSMGGMR